MNETEVSELIQGALERHSIPIDYRLLLAQCFVESSYREDAVSPAGAKGLMQLMPATWEQHRRMRDDVFDPYANVDVGVMYMRWLYGQWKAKRPAMDRLCLAFASYNAGLGHILAAQRKSGGCNLYSDIVHHLPEVTGGHAKETRIYVRRILVEYMYLVTLGVGA